MNQTLSQELITMAKQDIQLRNELEDGDFLSYNYHPKMKALHDRNADRLSAIIQEHGWPGKSKVGDEAAHAAWLILQHAIGHPQLQRKCFPMLVEQVETKEMDPVELAMLEDRIRCFEGKPQRFGTQFDWDENLRMSPLPVDDLELVKERRKRIGLEPLEDAVNAKRAEVEKSGERPPSNYKRYLAEKDEWFKANGWRS